MRNWTAGPRAGRSRSANRAASIAVVAALAGLTGCAGVIEDGKPGDTGPGVSFTSATVASVTPGGAPSPTAADGTDIAACADATCEINVSAPVTVPFRGPDGDAELSVTEVGTNKIAYRLRSGTAENPRTSTGRATGAGSGCTSVITRDGSSNSCGPVRGMPATQAGTVAMRLTGGPDGVALLVLRAGG